MRCPVRGLRHERSRIARSRAPFEILSLGSEPGAETTPSPPWREHNGSPTDSSDTDNMGKPNPSFDKRVREHKQRLKRQEKVHRKRERDAAKKLVPTDEADTDVPPTDPDASTYRPD